MSTLVDDARGVARVFEAHAGPAERAGTMPVAAVEATREAGLFHALLPTELGGGGLDATTAIEVLEILSRADGSCGWTVMANSLVTAISGAFVGDAAADRLFGDVPAILAGTLGPGGRSVRVAGGYRGSGRYSFGSGSGHATWLAGGMLVLDEDGEPERLPNGLPRVQVLVVPAAAATLIGNWDVGGLCGTGSYDFEIPDQIVGEEFTYERTSTDHRRGGAIFDIGVAGFSCVGHGGVALGITSRALTEVATLSMHKGRPGYPSVIGDHDLFLHGLARQEAAFQGARLYLYEVFADAQRSLAASETLTDEQRQRFRQALTHVHDVAADVVRWCYQWGGATAIRGDHPLGRCLRDINVATQHAYVDPLSYVAAGRAVRDKWAAEPIV